MEILLVADDLTGANVTGAALRKVGATAFTAVELDQCGPDQFRRYDALLCNTETRSATPEAAYQAVLEALQKMEGSGASLLVNRIDSTLRGNLGRETDAFLDYLGEEVTAVVVPGMPKGGRQVTGGKLFLNGVPLHETSVAQDPKGPIFTSDVAELFGAQSKNSITSVYLEEVRRGEEHLAQRLLECRRQGARIVILDAETEEDVGLAAGGTVLSGIPFVAVDPGSFTSALARLLLREKKRVLLAVGSVNSITRAQVDTLFRREDVYHVLLSVDRLCTGREEAQEEVLRAVRRILDQGEGFPACALVLDSIYPENRIDFDGRRELMGMDREELSAWVNSCIADGVEAVLREGRGFSRLFSCGGDITVAVCKRFGSSGIECQEEVMPLVLYGKFNDGKYPGFEIITKGGMVGDAAAIERCLEFYWK